MDIHVVFTNFLYLENKKIKTLLMKEEFLHYVWKHQLFNTPNLKTTDQEPLMVLNSGLHNKNSGPDFLNSKIEIEDQDSIGSPTLWYGNVEIHVKSSDWYLHQHETDENYDTVILHVVWEHDTDIYMKNNTPIPTLELKHFVDEKLLENYRDLNQKKLHWIPCEQELNTIDSFLKDNWLERLFVERLEAKSKLIQQLLEDSKNDYEATLFVMLAKNFGLKVNAEAFFNLATSIPYTIIRKEQNNSTKLSALFFGQAGFLSEVVEDAYHSHLKKEYEYLKHKYQLKPCSNHQFQFFRMRPSNFPTIRIAQLTALYHQHQNLFSKVMEIESSNDFYRLFEIELPIFWETHYTFTKTSKRRKKKFTKSFLDLLLINTIIPLQFHYKKSIHTLDQEVLLEMMRTLKPEKNSIISKFAELQVEAKNAFESQALLELKNNYCALKRCLQCAIGNQLLRN